MATPISSVRINPETGSLSFMELGITVDFMTRWKKFPEILKHSTRGSEEPGMGWISHHIGPFTFEGHQVALRFGFHYTELKSVYFTLADVTSPSKAPEPDTPIDEQMILQQAFELQLGVTLIKDGFTHFPWGSAVCCYHPKDGYLFAGIQHKSL
jgi:hypothetical protein